jgi:hypothetical protein
MAVANTVGYLITFDGTTLINHSTLLGASICQNGATVHRRTYVLPTGTVVNYDGTADAAVVPGEVSQDIFCTTGGATLYNTLSGKIGNYSASGAGGGLILSPLSGADVTVAAILLSVEDVSATPVERVSRMTIRVTFQTLAAWA